MLRELNELVDKYCKDHEDIAELNKDIFFEVKMPTAEGLWGGLKFLARSFPLYSSFKVYQICRDWELYFPKEKT